MIARDVDLASSDAIASVDLVTREFLIKFRLLPLQLPSRTLSLVQDPATVWNMRARAS